MMKANINRLDTFGLIKILFNQRLSIVDIKSSDINTSNTGINILPYREPG